MQTMQPDIYAKLRCDLMDAKANAIAKSASVRPELQQAADAVMGRWMGAEWMAQIATGVGRSRRGNTGDDDPGLSDQSIRKTLGRTSPMLFHVERVVVAELFTAGRTAVTSLQRSIYESDQHARAAAYDAATNPMWRIVARITDDELANLARWPINGVSGVAAVDGVCRAWSRSFRATLANCGGSVRRSDPAAIAAKTRGSFDSWVKEMSRVARSAGMVALHASAREFMAGLRRPANLVHSQVEES